MSLVVAIKKDGVIYMGADTRVSSEPRFHTALAPSGRKIQRLGDCYVGAVGRSGNIQLFSQHPEWFELHGEPLTKRFLVQEVVPKYYDALREEGRIEKPDECDTEPDCKCCFFVTDGQRMYRIKPSLAVVEHRWFIAIGCTEDEATVCMTCASPDNDPNEMLLRALRYSARINDGVGAPYFLINTKNQVFETVEG